MKTTSRFPFSCCCSRSSNRSGTARSRGTDLVVDQHGQIGENRVVDEVFEGHRPLQGDRQLQCRQRRAAQLEEVIPPADLVLRDAEYLCPCGRQPVLCCRTQIGRAHSELQSRVDLVCRLLLEKKKIE